MATKKRPDPKQVFIIQSTTRGDICRDINDLIENEGWDVPRLEPDDPRLDDEFCQNFADMSMEAVCEVDEVVDREYQHQRSIVAAHFDIDEDEEEEDDE